jgi:hypothetical protein
VKDYEQKILNPELRDLCGKGALCDVIFVCRSVHACLQCGGSGMFIPDPDFYPSRISDLGSRILDPKTAMKDIGEKKFVVKPFFVVINFTKLNYFIFEMLKKKIWANFQRIIELFSYPKNCL